MAESQTATSGTDVQEQQWLEYKSKYLQVTMQQKMNCSFDRWYKTFRKVTIKSKIIPIGETFVEYLKTDGLKLPPQIQNEMDNVYELDSDNDSDDPFSEEDGNESNSNDDSKSDEADSENNIDFSKMGNLLRDIAEKMKELKGAVVPKLNWSAPSDAKWINGETLKCEYISQIVLLLKSSQFVQHDLCFPFHGCSDFVDNAENVENSENVENVDNAENGEVQTLHTLSYQLVLRKWSTLHPNREFRCFVYDQELIAIAQRNDDDVYAELQSKSSRDALSKTILDFFMEKVHQKFMNDHFVMDVYVDQHSKVFVIDFQPFNEITDSVIPWMDICKAIEDEDRKEILFGFVDKEAAAKIRFSSKSQYRFPVDCVDLENEQQINEFVDSCNLEI